MRTHSLYTQRYIFKPPVCHETASGAGCACCAIPSPLLSPPLSTPIQEWSNLEATHRCVSSRILLLLERYLSPFTSRGKSARNCTYVRLIIDLPERAGACRPSTPRADPPLGEEDDDGDGDVRALGSSIALLAPIDRGLECAKLLRVQNVWVCRRGREWSRAVVKGL